MEHIYRAKLLPYLIFITLSTVAGTALYPLYLFMALDLDVSGVVVDLLVLSLLWGLVWAVIIVAVFRYKITSSGLRGYNLFGIPRFIRWDEITTCKDLNMAGLRYVRIYARKIKYPVWVPVFMHNKQQMIADMADFGVNENCLLRHLLQE